MFTASQFHGVMVSTVESEFSNPSLNLGGTFKYFELGLSPSQDENALLVNNEVLVRNVIHFKPLLLTNHHL
jgi:hypothetical protein